MWPDEDNIFLTERTGLQEIDFLGDPWLPFEPAQGGARSRGFGELQLPFFLQALQLLLRIFTLDGQSFVLDGGSPLVVGR